MAIWLRRDKLLARDWAGDAMTVTLAVSGSGRHGTPATCRCDSIQILNKASAVFGRIDISKADLEIAVPAAGHRYGPRD
jgi:hypothetical protein